MKVEKTKLNDVLRISLDVFKDHRGYYIETYNEDQYRENGINVPFIQDDISVSYKHVLRGIHGDQKTWKLISCLEGSFLLVVVNNDENSPQFKQWDTFTLLGEDNYQILVPPKFGNGHLVLSKKAIFHYKQSTNYNPEGQFTLLWNDPELDISWPIQNPILSKRDELGHFID